MRCRRAVHPLLFAMFAFFLALFLTAFLAGAIASAQDNAATAGVLVAKLNVRSGPGTSYARVGQVSAGDVLTVTGQAQNCAWLKVQTAKLDGWVSGQRQYVRLDTPCSRIPAAAVKPAAAPTAAPTTVPTELPAGTPTVAPIVEPTAEPTAEPTSPDAPAQDPLPPGLGCLLIVNQVGPELNVTTTNKDNNKSENFKVPANGEMVWCLDPGSYAFTIDAPPPWDDINTDIKINAGDRLAWTIGRKE